MFIVYSSEPPTPAAPSGAAACRMPLLTELGGKIHRIAINIALLRSEGIPTCKTRQDEQTLDGNV
jgi:hypothetical protein